MRDLRRHTANDAAREGRVQVVRAVQGLVRSVVPALRRCFDIDHSDIDHERNGNH